MTEKIKQVIEDLTKDCTQEDKAKILQIVTPGEPGAKKKRVKMDYTSEEFERIKPILDGILAAMSQEQRKLEKVLKIKYEWENEEERKKAAEAQEVQYKTKSEQFKKQLEEAHKFREKRFNYGLELAKVRYLYELEHTQEWEGITNAFNYGYMVGYKAAQRNARKKKKAAAANQEGAKRA